MAILDHSGNPISSADLGEAQTATLAHLHNEFAGHPSRGLTPARLAQILEDAENGDITAQHELYEDMEEKDAHIFAEMSKRKRAIVGLDWDIVPPREATAQEQRAAELAKAIIQDSACIEDIIFDMADAIGHAFACIEMEWQLVGSEWLPVEFHHRPQTWFLLTQEHRNDPRLRDNQNPDGAELQPFGWIKHIHRAKSGYLARAGLHRILAWPFLFKNYSVRDLAEFLEIYGLPLRLGTYPPGSSDDEKRTLLKAVVGIGHNAAGIIPEGMMIEFQEAAKGSNGPFDAMIDWTERSESKAILGATLTSQTDSGSGAMALGKVHNEVRKDLRDADALQIAATLTRDLIYPIVALNTSGVDSLRRSPRFVFDVEEPEDLKLFAEAVPKLVEVGLPVPASYVQDKLRIPKPEGGELVLAAAAQPAPPPVPNQAAATAALKRQVDDGPADEHADQLSRTSARPLKAWLDKLHRLVERSDSLEALRNELVDAYGDLDDEQLVKVMETAFATAELAGRFEASGKK